jgi:hypothetical protein
MKRFRAFFLVIAAIAIFAQAGKSLASPPAGEKINLPKDTAILATLETSLDASHTKTGDPVAAITLQDVKQGHQVVLKKGSTLTGHVEEVIPFATGGGQSTIGIIFDSATPKDGAQASLNVEIRALSLAANVKNDTIIDGRGMAQSANNATVSGHENASTGSVSQLSLTSTGVYGMKGLSLAVEIDKDTHISLINSSVSDVRLGRGSQVLFRAVGE